MMDKDKEDEDMLMAGVGNVMKLFTNERTGFDRAGFEDMLIQYSDSGAKAKGVKLMDFALDFLGISGMKEGGRIGFGSGSGRMMETFRLLEEAIEKNDTDQIEILKSILRNEFSQKLAKGGRTGFKLGK